MLTGCDVSPEERLARAQQAFEEHRFSATRLDLGTLLQADENDPQALELLVRTQLMLGDGVGAEATLTRMDGLGIRPADHQELLAEAFIIQGALASAAAAGEALATANGLRIAALAYIGLGESDAARDAFYRGLDADGDRSRLYADYARFAALNGDLSRARSLARQALEADPDGLDPLLASADIAQTAGAYPQALKYYEQAHASWPESRAALLGRIGMLGDMGKMQDARDLVSDAARRMPNDPDVIYLQARLAADDGDWTRVRTLLQPIEDSEDTRTQQLYARSLLELDLPEQALPKLTAIVRRSPQAVEARRALADAQMALGDAGAAFDTIGPLAISANGTPGDIALYRKAADRTGRAGQVAAAFANAPPERRIAALLAQADADMRAQRWPAAIAAYEQLRRWTGDSNAMVLNNIAYAKSRTGQTAQALSHARAALKLAPDNASVIDTAGWLMVQSGQDRARGLQLLEKAARLAPDNADIAEHLKQARKRS
ncbi:tetratricopeptide repeat protein [Aurantiacibacter rhizosphaerae]|nr:tetratricopeptide repeat protein [Aurantiacibacter rhizosphaerae]